MVEPVAPPGFFRPITNRTVAKALPPALAWSYVAAIAGAVLLGAIAALALAVAAIVWIFNRELVIGNEVREVMNLGLWLTGPLVVGAAVGAAAYGSTEKRSFPRTAIGTGVAVAIGVALLGLKASGFAAGALAVGWALAIPSDRLWRVAARGFPLLIAAVLFAGLPVGRLEDAGTWPLVAV
ncbi:MAG: hypothetical protein OEO77_04830, partial [Acidimicrobiia bacterium]|nr:hypothetical protein [Acidimicrobiia bacterium]